MATRKGLEKQLEFYIKNQAELLKTYEGKYIVIKNEKILGSYESEMEAYVETIKEHKVGSFLIQLCLPGEDNYTQTFHSHVAFV
jgi:hypothetical protein